MPSKRTEWQGLIWDTKDRTLELSQDNIRECRKVFLALLCQKVHRKQWESLIGSMNWAKAVVPLGPLRLNYLIYKGNRLFFFSNLFIQKKLNRSIWSKLAY